MAGAARAHPPYRLRRTRARARPALLRATRTRGAPASLARKLTAPSHAVDPWLQMKLITIATVSDRLKIQGSLARAAIKELVTKGTIKAVNYHSQSPVYTRGGPATE